MVYGQAMTRTEAASRRLLRARDAMDRRYAGPLDVPELAQIALTSEAHFIRTFKQTFGETPHRYLQRRRLERAMALLRETDRPVTDICLEVGFTSLGTFSRTFTRVLGMPPTAYRAAWRAGAGTAGYVPTCVVMAWTRSWSPGAGRNGVIFSVDDCRATYEDLVAKDVEFTQEPTEHFYGVDCGLRDPFGNPLRFTQPAPAPIEAPDADAATPDAPRAGAPSRN